MAINRYRIFMKEGPYEIGVGNNRHEAIKWAEMKGVPKSKMKSIVKIKGNGKQRVFNIGGNN